MKAKDLRERSTDDLQELEKSLRRDVFSYRMKNAVGQQEDTSLLKRVRRDIARIQTILTQRSQEAEGDQA